MGHSIPTLADLENEQCSLVKSSLSSNTWKTYDMALESYRDFRLFYNLEDTWPIPINSIAKFIAYLSCQKASVSTVSTYISGLSFAHKIREIKDTTKSFVVQKLIEGFRRKHPSKADVRLPICRVLLKKLICSLQKICHSQYEAKMFSAAFSLAYFGMLRVSEISVQGKTANSDHALNFDDIEFRSENANLELFVKISSSKTDQKGKSTTLILNSIADSAICPIALLRAFLEIRANCTHNSNKLFIHFNGTPLTNYQFRSILQKSLKFCEVPLHIRTHSFRIGRATEMAINGVPDDIIQKNGRWSSMSYLRYIRL